MGKENDMKFYLHDLKHVNTVLGLLYDKDGKYRPGFSPEEFYNTILLDTLKYGEENYVHLKYAETVNISKSQSVARFRRWAGMTPVIRPMVEGMPPAPDKFSYEYMEVGNVFSFGRWSEFTDQIDMSVVSDLVAERSNQYGENAAQTKELYARKEWLSSPNEFYANFKDGIKDILFGDNVTIDDLRFLTLRMKRAQVKPIGGKFNYICSIEFVNGLIDDPRVQAWMKINQTTGNMWNTGEAVPLFDLNFIPTMLDEFAYPDTEFPGVYEDPSTGKEVIRLYAKENGVIYYLDIEEDFTVGGTPVKNVVGGVTYLNDGTAVENKESWEVPKTLTLSSSNTVGNAGSVSSNKVRAFTTTVSRVTVDSNGKPVIPYYTYGTKTDITDYGAINSLISKGEFTQLPIHRGILFGDEAMIKINKEGLSDAPRIIVKALGSSGVNDPLDQRQSVGYRVDGFGLAIKRPEAICVTYGIPTNAEFAYLTAEYVQSAATGALEYEGEYITDKGGNRIQATVVDAINNPYDASIGTALVDAMNKYELLVLGKTYAVNDLVQVEGVPYKVKTAGVIATDASAIANSTAYVVGNIVKASDVYYICTAAYTSASTAVAPGSDTTHWRKATQAELTAKAFATADKSKLTKDSDRLITNLFTKVNHGDSNVR